MKNLYLYGDALALLPLGSGDDGASTIRMALYVMGTFMLVVTILSIMDVRPRPPAKKIAEGTPKSIGGSYTNSLKNGPWVEALPESTLTTSGQYTDGKKTGVWEVYDEDWHKCREQRYESGVLSGIQRDFLEDGRVTSETEMRDGMRHGREVSWDERGRIRVEQMFNDDQPHGRSIIWYPNGRKEQEGLYENGSKEGQLLGWWKNGQERFVIEYKDGLKVHAKWFHQNGKTRWASGYKNEAEDGPWTAWYDNGQKEEEGVYQHGLKQGRWTYWERSGRRVCEIEYKDNWIHGQCTRWNADGSVATEESGLYERGKKIDPEADEEFLETLQRVAEQGHGSSQHHLGVMYFNGDGAPQDYVRSYAWFNVSAGSEYQGAVLNAPAAAKQCVERMTREQIAQAQKLSREIYERIEANKKKDEE